MDRLVKVDVKELQLTFKPGQICTATFQLTNLMHTMAVAVSLSTTNPSLFSFNHPLSILSPLSSSLFSLFLTDPSDEPPLSSSSYTLFVRTTMLPTGKANSDDLRRIFAKPGPHVFKDGNIPISFIGEDVVQFLLLSPPAIKTLEIGFLLSKAISGCSSSQINSLLRSSVLSGNPNFVSALIEAGGDVNDRDSNGKSVMSVAVSSGHVEIARVLIESGCKINGSIDLFLHDAAALNQVDLMGILSGEGGINVNSIDSMGRNPIHVSAIHGHIEALRFCVSIGTNPDSADFNGWTPLHCAAAEGHKECVEFLLECSSSSKYAVNKEGKAPFSLAIDNGNTHLLDLLRLNDLLLRLARLDDVHGIKSCLAQGANVNERDQNGWTPLHRAAFKGRLESVKLLVDHGAQVDFVDDVGYTPLHCAVEAGHTQVALYLISHGAFVNLKSLKSLCPFMVDSLKNHPSLVLPLCEKELELKNTSIV